MTTMIANSVDFNADVAAARAGKILQIPAGVKEVVGTIDTQHRIGLIMQGVGSGYPMRPGHQFEGASSVLCRNDQTPNDQPMLNLRGLNVCMRDFTFQGDAFDSAAPLKYASLAIHKFNKYRTRPDVCIQLVGEPGIGASGKHILENLYFQDFGTCIKAGLGSVYGNNCDTTLVRNLQSTTCDTIFHSQMHMALDWSFETARVHFYHLPKPGPPQDPSTQEQEAGTGKVFHIQAGGKFSASNIFCASPCTVLTLDACKATDDQNYTGIAGNGALFAFDGVDVDAQAGSGFRLLDVPEALWDSYSFADVMFSDVVITPRDYEEHNARLVVLRGGVCCTINNGYNIQRGMVGWHTNINDRYAKHIKLFNCRMDADTADEVLKLGFSNGDIYLTAHNCHKMNGDPIPNIETTKIMGSL